jgi:hypothetical protein
MSEEGKLGVGEIKRAILTVPPQEGNAKPLVSTRSKDEVQLPFVMYMQRLQQDAF